MRAAKVDGNQAAIVKELRAMGFSVATGHDDIIVGDKGKSYWFEIKNLDEISPKTGEVRPSKVKASQAILRDTWRGHYSIVWSVEQILYEMGYG